ncbi:MAG TPA: AAA-like domain-containing protein [Blastocatellia bacterium]|nr:AAA-like domain-containing protein [Blastocatellia bacterium]
MAKTYEFGPFRLDTVKRLLLRDGAVVPLKPKAFETLLALVERHGQVAPKDELMRSVWPDSFVEEGNLSLNIHELRRALGETPDDHSFIVTVPGHGYVFVAPVRRVPDEDSALIVAERARVSIVVEEDDDTSGDDGPPAFQDELEDERNEFAEEQKERLGQVGGAVPLDSAFYIERATDAEFLAAVRRRDSIVLVKGARQVGKTSLLARGLQQARLSGARVVLTDLQTLNLAHSVSVESFFLMLAKSIARSLDLEVAPSQVWDEDLGPSQNFADFMRRELLGKITTPLVWGLDEVDRLFTCDFGGEVFGLFRSWHNARALDPEGPWARLTLAMAYATEAHLFITDMHQSPFNVGARLTLEDFTIEQVAELNRRYGSPLRTPAELDQFFDLVGGHPYLARSGLREMAARGLSPDALAKNADRDEGPFGDHLRRLLASLRQDAALCEIAQGVMRGEPCPTAESFYRLRSGGVVIGDEAREAKPRCRLYASYLARHSL